MRNFVYQIRCTLWSIAAELEYSLYPWKTKEPPQWAIERYNYTSEVELSTKIKFIYQIIGKNLLTQPQLQLV